LRKDGATAAAGTDYSVSGDTLEVNCKASCSGNYLCSGYEFNAAIIDKCTLWFGDIKSDGVVSY